MAQEGLNLITETPEEGMQVAIRLARLGVTETQPDREVLHSLRPEYATDFDALIASSHVIAGHFQTVAAANDYWRQGRRRYRLRPTPGGTAADAPLTSRLHNPFFVGRGTGPPSGGGPAPGPSSLNRIERSHAHRLLHPPAIGRAADPFSEAVAALLPAPPFPVRGGPVVRRIEPRIDGAPAMGRADRFPVP